MNRPFSANRKAPTRTRLALSVALFGGLVTIAAAAPTIIPFTITSGKVKPAIPFVARITMLGSAIQTTSDGGYHLPVTMQLHVKNTVTNVTDNIDPFGPFSLALSGNVNPEVEGSNLTGAPLKYLLLSSAPGGINPAILEISLSGRSWLREEDESGSENDDWYIHMTKNSVSNPASVKLLRDGDPVPAVEGFLDQDSVEYYLRKYVDEDTNTMQLDVNEAIYLFELGTTNSDLDSFDLQDLVVLIRLAASVLELDEPGD